MVPKGSPRNPRGFPRVPKGFPRAPQRVPKGSPRGPRGPQESARVTGRLRSRWNDGVAPKSAALLDALRTSCERRVEPCLHIERLSASLTSWYDFSHTLRGLDRRNPRKLTTVQHFSMVSMVLRCRHTHFTTRPTLPLDPSGALQKSRKRLKSVVLSSIFKVCAHLGANLAHLGAISAHLGAILAHLGAILTHLSAILVPYWPILAPS